MRLTDGHIGYNRLQHRPKGHEAAHCRTYTHPVRPGALRYCDPIPLYSTGRGRFGQVLLHCGPFRIPRPDQEQQQGQIPLQLGKGGGLLHPVPQGLAQRPLCPQGPILHRPHPRGTRCAERLEVRLPAGRGLLRQGARPLPPVTDGPTTAFSIGPKSIPNG